MKFKNDLPCFFFNQMIKARVEILNLSVAYSAIQSFSRLYTCCTATVYLLLNDLSAMTHTAQALKSEIIIIMFKFILIQCFQSVVPESTPLDPSFKYL